MDSIISGNLPLRMSESDNFFVSEHIGSTEVKESWAGGSKKMKEKKILTKNLNEIFKKFPLFEKLPQLLKNYLQVRE